MNGLQNHKRPNSRKSRISYVIYQILAFLVGLTSIEAQGKATALQVEGVAAARPFVNPEDGPAPSGVSSGAVDYVPLPGNVEVQIAAFTLSGSKPWERIVIPDLGIIRISVKHSYLSLNGLLRAFQLQKTESGDCVTFQPEGFPEVTIDSNKKELRFSESIKTIDLIALSSSQISQEPDLFIHQAVIAELFSMELEWNEQGYEYLARTNRRLAIWKVSKGTSLFSIESTLITSKLPELLPPAYPANFSLDFAEFRLLSGFSSKDNLSSLEGGVSLVRETLWGNFLGGEFKLQFSQPQPLLFNERLNSTMDTSRFVLSKGDWTFRYLNAVVTAGDSSFGINDLVFPTVRMTGLRFNGVIGLTEDEKRWDRSSLGARNFFMQPRTFSGIAPRGSQVTLTLNDRLIDTQDVFIDGTVAPGMGLYRFEDIALNPGSLNEVIITVIEPNGQKTTIKEDIAVSSQLAPKGKIAYIGGIGTARDAERWSNHGIFGGGRGLYGITDRLSAGASAAFQRGFMQRQAIDALTPNFRQYPEQSLHVGGQIIWLPIESVLLSSDLSLSHGQGNGGGEAGYNDIAFKLSADFYPARRMSVHPQYFRYGPDFFDGQNSMLRDREGVLVSSLWLLPPDWTFGAAAGRVWDNLDGNRANTLMVDFQKMHVTTKSIHSTTMTLEAERLSSNWESEGKILYTMKLLIHPFSDVYVSGAYSTGSSLNLADNSDFLSGLKLPGISLSNSPGLSANIRKAINRANDLEISYWKSDMRERASFAHSLTAFQRTPVRIKNEIGYDLDDQGLFFDSRSAFSSDIYSRHSVELQTRFEKREWLVALQMSLNETVSFHDGGLHIADSGINPDFGGVCGMVFLDSNANGVKEQGEPGIENIKIVLGNFSAESDQYGYFILPVAGQTEKVRVYVDPNSIPAIYSLTHGIQTAFVNPGNLTEVNFGIIPVISLVGKVVVRAVEAPDIPLSGVRVYVTRPDSLKSEGESYTARDGSFYIGDMKPGRYLLRVDTGTLPKYHFLVENKREIEILPVKEPQELNTPVFQARFAAPGTQGPGMQH